MHFPGATHLAGSDGDIDNRCCSGTRVIPVKLKKLEPEAELERSCAMCGAGIHSQDQLPTGMGMELEAVPAATPLGHGLGASRGSDGILDCGQGGRTPETLGRGVPWL